MQKGTKEDILQHCGISECYFSDLDLSGVDISRKTFMHCSFRDVSLEGTDLSNCTFEYCTFSSMRTDGETNFRNTTFYFCDMRCAWLDGLKGKNLSFDNIEFSSITSEDINCKALLETAPIVCPETGSFTGWKKCVSDGGTLAYIVELEIPADAERLSCAIFRASTLEDDYKCRASKAIVKNIYTYPEGELCDKDKVVNSSFNWTFKYQVGETVMPEEPFCNDRRRECASGIHFFMRRSEAEAY